MKKRNTRNNNATIDTTNKADTTNNQGGISNFSDLGIPIRLCTRTIRRQDGRLQTFCGLQITNSGGSLDAEEAPQPPHAPKTQPQRETRHLQPVDAAEEQSLPATDTESGNIAKVAPTQSPTLHPTHKSSGTQVLYGKLEYPKYKCHFCNATMWKEEKRTTTTKANLTYTICYQEGKVKMPKLHDTPEPLKHLLEGRTTNCADFRQKIRVYNSIFSFTSFGARIDEKINQSCGPYTFRILGQNYHILGSLMPEDGDPPRYAQLYFSDTGNKLRNRMGCMNLTSKDVDQTIVLDLMKMMHLISSVAKAFIMAKDWATSNDYMEFRLKLIGERKPNERQYNLPTVSEVAALIVGDFGQSTAPRDVYIQNKSKGPQRISELHPFTWLYSTHYYFPMEKMTSMKTFHIIRIVEGGKLKEDVLQ